MTKSTLYNTQHPFIQKQIEEKIRPFNFSDTEKAICLYNFVRDNWLYSPLRISLKEEEYQTNYLVNRKEGHCIDKALILITLLKAANVPARLGLAKVKNHIAAEKIIAFLGTDVLVPHGYVEIFLEEKWVKATPAFNKSLCEKLNVAVLEFDGKEDSIFQKFCAEGNQFMEYLEDYGSFEELPTDFIERIILEHYPVLKKFGFKKGEAVDFSMFT